jgi:C4-dicarboxylate-specific signal transduction histidine kinase
VAILQLDVVAAEIRGLLALGRQEDAAPVTVDVADLVARVGRLVGPRCEHAGVRLEHAVRPGLRTTGHPEALRAALVNLVLNAIDAAGRDGLVRIVGEGVGDDEAVRITVEDDGPGPPHDLAATLCDPFVTGKPEGVGLGLTVAGAVAERHAGALSWARGDGRTRFTITLPQAAATIVGSAS